MQVYLWLDFIIVGIFFLPNFSLLIIILVRFSTRKVIYGAYENHIQKLAIEVGESKLI